MTETKTNFRPSAAPVDIFAAKGIITMDPSRPRSTAVAVREGKVLAVGSVGELQTWLGDEAKTGFRDQYAHARDMQADALFDEALEIADDVSGDWSTDKDGKKVLDHEHIQRSRLRVDTRKWAAGKLAPKRYGDKMQHTGDGGGPIRTEVDLTGIPIDVLRDLRKLAARI